MLNGKKKISHVKHNPPYNKLGKQFKVHQNRVWKLHTHTPSSSVFQLRAVYSRLSVRLYQRNDLTYLEWPFCSHCSLTRKKAVPIKSLPTFSLITKQNMNGFGKTFFWIVTIYKNAWRFVLWMSHNLLGSSWLMRSASNVYIFPYMSRRCLSICILPLTPFKWLVF